MTDYTSALARLRYKPNVTLTCYDDNGTPTFLLSTDGANSRRADHQTRPFTVTRAIRRGLTDEQVRDAAIALIAWWELHEMFEWLRLDGTLIWDPHDETGRAIGQHVTP